MRWTALFSSRITLIRGRFVHVAVRLRRQSQVMADRSLVVQRSLVLRCIGNRDQFDLYANNGQ